MKAEIELSKKDEEILDKIWEDINTNQNIDVEES